MADDIVIRLSGQDDVSPILRQIADNLDYLSSQMAGVGNAALAAGDLMASSMGDAMRALEMAGAVAGESALSVSALGDAFGRMGLVTDATMQAAIASALDFQGALAELSLRSGSVADAFGIDAEAIGALRSALPFLAADMDAVGKDLALSADTGVASFRRLDAAFTDVGLSSVAVRDAALAVSTFDGAALDAADRGKAWRDVVAELQKQLGLLGQTVATGALALDDYTFANDRVLASDDAASAATRTLAGGLDGVNVQLGVLSGLLDDAARLGKVDAETFAELSDAISFGIAASSDEASARFALLGANIKTGADAAKLSIAGLTDQFQAVSAAAGGDTAIIETWRAALASGSTDLQALYANTDMLAKLMVGLRQALSDSSDSVVNLSSAAGDLVIRQAAVNDAFAQSIGLDQDQAAAYVGVTDQIVQVSSAMKNLTDLLGITKASALDTLAPIADMGANFSASADAIIAQSDAARVTLDLFTQRVVAFGASGDVSAGEFRVFQQALSDGSLTMRQADLTAQALGQQYDNLLAKLSVAARAAIDFATASGEDVVQVAASNEKMAQAVGITQALAQQLLAARDAVGMFKARLADTHDMLQQVGIDENNVAVQAKAMADAQVAATDKARWDALGVSAKGATTEVGGFKSVIAGTTQMLADNAFNLLLVGATMASTGIKAAQAGMDFQSQWAVVKNLSANFKDVNYGLEKMQQDLINLAPALGQTPAALAQGLYYIQSAGIHGADALDTLKYVAYGASGGLGSMKDVASAVTTLLDDYGVKAGGAANVTGLLIDAVTAGKTTIEAFASNLGKVTSTAADAHYNIVDLMAGMDALTRSGLSTAQSATYLRATMQNLGLNTEGVAKAADKFGISIDSVKLKQMALHDTGNGLQLQLQYLQDATMKQAAAMGLSGDAAKNFADNAMLKMIGGIRSGTGAIAISTDQFRQFKDALGQISTSAQNGGYANAIQAHFAAISQTLGFAVMQMKAAFAAFGSQFIITFGPQILQVLHAFTATIQRATAYMQDHVGNATTLFHRLGAIIAMVFGGTLFASALELFKFSERLRGVEGPGLKLTSVFGAFGTKLYDLKTHMAFAGGEAKGFAGALQTLVFRSGDVGRAFGGDLAPRLYDLKTHMAFTIGHGHGLLGMFQQLGLGVTNFGAALRHPGLILDALSGKLQFLGKITPGLGGLFDGVRASILGGGDAIAAGVGKMIQVITHPMAIVRLVAMNLTTVMSSAIPAIMSFGASFLAILGPALLIAGAIAIVVIAFIKFRPQLMGALGALWETVRPILLALVGMILLFVKQIETEWKTLGPRIMPAMQHLITIFGQMGPALVIVGVVVKAVLAVILAVLAGVVQGFLRALPYIITFFSGLLSLITNISMLIIAIFHGKWGMIPGILGDIFASLRQIVASSLGALVMFVSGAILAIIQWFNKLTGGALSGVLSFVTGIVKWFQHLFDVLVGHSIIPDMVNAIIRWILLLPVRVLGVIAQFVVNVVTNFIRLETLVTNAVIALIGATVTNFLRLESAVLSAVVRLVLGTAAKFLLLENLVIGVVVALVMNVVNHFTTLGLSVINRIVWLAQMASAAANLLRSNVVGAIMALVSGVLGLIGGLASGFLAKVAGLVSGAGASFSSLVGVATSALSGLPGALAGIASNAMSSMVGAISGAAGRLGNAAKGVVGSIINSAKSMLGIASPSRVFLEIGHNTAEGMAQGIERQARRVNDAARKSFGVSNLSVGSGAVGGGMGGGGVLSGAPMSYRPTGGASSGLGGGSLHVTVQVNGGLGEGLRLMSATDRRRLAFQIGQEMALATGLQGIVPLGYSGRGTI